MWGTPTLSNIVANVVLGYVSDKIGRIRTVAWFLVGHSYSGALLGEAGGAPNIRAMVFVKMLIPVA
ncbi:hypothetical protein GCM10009574_093810 [Streptomyces asiaticus]|uniref:Major facilitator superfamily (MFS) profile domain-containing protein n=2 Tax=Streptomyces rhizosphaericus TaxID=114699 RepID=A0ABN1RD80_9ACTN